MSRLVSVLIYLTVFSFSSAISHVGAEDGQRLASQSRNLSTDSDLIAEVENAIVGFAEAREEFPRHFAFYVRTPTFLRT